MYTELSKSTLVVAERPTAVELRQGFLAFSLSLETKSLDALAGRVTSREHGWVNSRER